jgi:hypothetical protein
MLLIWEKYSISIHLMESPITEQSNYAPKGAPSYHERVWVRLRRAVLRSWSGTILLMNRDDALSSIKWVDFFPSKCWLYGVSKIVSCWHTLWRDQQQVPNQIVLKLQKSQVKKNPITKFPSCNIFQYLKKIPKLVNPQMLSPKLQNSHRVQNSPGGFFQLHLTSVRLD